MKFIMPPVGRLIRQLHGAGEFPVKLGKILPQDFSSGFLIGRSVDYFLHIFQKQSLPPQKRKRTAAGRLLIFLHDRRCKMSLQDLPADRKRIGKKTRLNKNCTPMSIPPEYFFDLPAQIRMRIPSNFRSFEKFQFALQLFPNTGFQRKIIF